MQYDTVGASPTTVHMLQYIRNHVRSAFDKTFEDAMGVYYGKSTERWSYQLQQHHYDVDLRQFYNTHIESKQADLENLITYFDDLKD